MLPDGGPDGKPWAEGSGQPLPSATDMRRPTIVALAATLTVTVAGVLALASAQPGTSSPAPAAGRCGAEVKEELDPRSLQHVLFDTPPPQFASEHPTSGPHSPVERSGVQPEPLSPVLQVGLLEEGSILLQHQGLDDRARQRLEALAGPDVVVAPGGNLPDTVLATAWTFKMRCDGVEPDALRSFITRHQGRGLA